MAGLSHICKIYGSLKVTRSDGKEIEWIYDYVNDKPRLKSEMSKEEIKESKKYKLNKK